MVTMNEGTWHYDILIYMITGCTKRGMGKCRAQCEVHEG